ncbi:MAG: hypothetical protein IJ300_09210 [Clostridia bacterium]|nr:hypothetical protein [Clostridia bacterium]
MKSFFIYSAGGGAGDWNGIKRIWNDCMPQSIKSKILLKFGDIFLEHATGTRVIRPQRWANINNLRSWLYKNTSDEFVLSPQCSILLDSGTAKAVNLIAYHNPDANCKKMIEAFNKMFYDNNIFEKYISIVCDSEINNAVTFDIPNPFKIRSQSSNTRLNILEKDSNNKLISLSAEYSNILYKEIKKRKGTDFADSVVTTIINGTWTQPEIDLFLSKLEYNPYNSIAIGGLSSTSINPNKIGNYLDNLVPYKFEQAKTLHFLGCGGLKKAQSIKHYGYNKNNTSVDCSTYINRSIDGRTDGKAQSGYFDYNSKALIRISSDTKKQILHLHNQFPDSLFSCEQMEEIIDTVILHQSKQSSLETYNARAKLIIHNADVFRYNVEARTN